MVPALSRTCLSGLTLDVEGHAEGERGEMGEEPCDMRVKGGAGRDKIGL